MGERRRHSAAFKAKVAVEAIRGERPANELASQYQVHPAQVAAWKRQALEGLPGVFSNGRGKGQKGEEELRAQLYQEIGQLKVELDFLKKRAGLVD
jgi:putative transposase